MLRNNRRTFDGVMRRGLLALAVLMTGLLLMMARPARAAESTWTLLPVQWGQTDATKVGERYFSVTQSGVLRCGMAMDLLDTVVAEDAGSAVTDGKTVIYTVAEGTDSALMRLDITEGKRAKLKTLKGGSDAEPDAWRIEAVYGDSLFLTRSSDRLWKFRTYVYRLDTKKCRKVLDGGGISLFENGSRYVVTDHLYRSDVQPTKLCIYGLTKAGMKLKKELGWCTSAARGAGRIWYIALPSYEGEGVAYGDAELWCSRVNGAGAKKVATFAMDGWAYVEEVKADGSCVVVNGGVEKTYK